MIGSASQAGSEPDDETLDLVLQRWFAARRGEEPAPRDTCAHDAIPGARYRVLGEIGRGGMGLVLHGRDLQMDRDVALKVLLDRHRKDRGLVERFLNEARICASLQHPAIVPVYEFGLGAAGQPYLAMKLVMGKTLASQLAERGTTDAEARRLLGVFELVCQAVAYAHARGVVHRDLKPSNVMIGSFGEVQVMDWGCAMLVADAPPAATERGIVVGTAAYMAPEQARGEGARVGIRADVFSLGSILCEILTGKPAYAGAGHAETRQLAARGDLADAQRRLGATRVDRTLAELAVRCLSVDMDARPADGSVVAAAVREHLTRSEERARAAEIAAAQARLSARYERKRRRVIGAAGLVVLLAVGALAVVYHGWERATRRRLQPALEAAHEAVGAAKAAPRDQGLWEKAARRADDAALLLEAGVGTAGYRAEVTRLQDGVRSELAQAGKDQALRRRLEEIRAESWFDMTGRRDSAVSAEMAEAYHTAFAEYGIDLRSLSVADAARRIRGSREARVLCAALDTWVKRAHSHPGADWRRLVEIVQASDPHPWRLEARHAWLRGDLEALRTLAKSVGHDPASLLLLQGIAGAFDSGFEREILASAATSGELADDFWIQTLLSSSYAKVEPTDPGAALRHAEIAWTHRLHDPLAWFLYGLRQIDVGDPEAARRTVDQAVERFPGDVRLLALRGIVLAERTPDLLSAIAARAPGDTQLGVWIRALTSAEVGNLVGAVELLERALRMEKGTLGAEAEIGIAVDRARLLGDLGRSEDAVREFDRLIAKDPRNQNTWSLLVNFHCGIDGGGAAVAAAERSLSLRPDSAECLIMLAAGLAVRGESGDLKRWVQLAERAASSPVANVILGPGVLSMHLGDGLLALGDHDAAVKSYGRARVLGNAGWVSAPASHRIGICRRLAVMGSEAVEHAVRGEAEPAAAAEIDAIAWSCSLRQRHARALELWLRLPEDAGELWSGSLEQAAISASRVAQGRTGAARVAAARHAIAWLERLLEELCTGLRSPDKTLVSSALRRITTLRGAADLAAVREPAELLELPDADRQRCASFWTRTLAVLGLGPQGGSELAALVRRGGRVDAGFGTGGHAVFRPESRPRIRRIVPCRDGGTASLLSFPKSFAVARFDASGRLVSGFGAGGAFASESLGQGADCAFTAAELLLTPDERLVVVGSTVRHNVAGAPEHGLFVVRLGRDGRLEDSFARGAADSVAGAVLLGAPALGVTAVGRLEVQTAVRDDRNGSLIVSGSLGAAADGAARLFVAKLDAEGRLDTGFGPGGGGVFAGPVLRATALSLKRTVVQSSGRILLFGAMTQPGQPPRPMIAAFLASGSGLDPGYGESGVFELPISSHVLHGGVASRDTREDLLVAVPGAEEAISWGSVCRVDANSKLVARQELSAARWPAPRVRGTGMAIARDPNGRVLLAGLGASGAETRIVVWRLDSELRSDPTFGSLGVASYPVSEPEHANYTPALAVDTAGGILVGGPWGTLRILP